MGAKKVWDSRRSSENSNPVSEIADLPKYVPSRLSDTNVSPKSAKSQQYIT